jgi:hypothetical protein
LKNNIIFFENYLKTLNNNNKPNNLEDFMKIIPETPNEKKLKRNIHSGNNFQKKKDLIEENVRAFDESERFDYDSSKIDKMNKNKKNQISPDKKEINSHIQNNTNSSSKYISDENYFKELINRNFN